MPDVIPGVTLGAGPVLRKKHAIARSRTSRTASILSAKDRTHWVTGPTKSLVLRRSTDGNEIT
jgi:hypothetical protein